LPKAISTFASFSFTFIYIAMRKQLYNGPRQHTAGPMHYWRGMLDLFSFISVFIKQLPIHIEKQYCDKILVKISEIGRFQVWSLPLR